MLVPAVTVAGPVLVTAISARVRTVVVAVALLLAPDTSVVMLLAIAVLLTVAPLTALGLRRTTTENVADAPAGSVAIVSPMKFALFVRLNAGPVVWICETNVVPAGSESVRTTVWASLGPVL